MATLELKLVCVQIQRNKDVVNVTAPEHEVRVLKAMHGPDNVRQVAELDPEVESYDVDDNADAELGRLDRKYRHNGQRANPVDVAFPGRDRDPLLASYGFRSGIAMEEAPQSMTRVRKPPKKKAAEKK